MQNQPYKVCPKCQTPALVGAMVCANCKHQYRTDFINQTQMIPASNTRHLPTAEKWSFPIRFAIAIASLLVLASLSFALFFGYRALRPEPAFSGTWAQRTTMNETIGLSFYKDGTGTIFWHLVPENPYVQDGTYTLHGKRPFVWKQDGEFIILRRQAGTPPTGNFFPVDALQVPFAYHISEGGHVLVLQRDTTVITMAKQFPELN